MFLEPELLDLIGSDESFEKYKFRELLLELSQCLKRWGMASDELQYKSHPENLNPKVI